MIDTENLTAEERVVAEAVDGPTFDDLVTGEIPTHVARVAATPKPADPVPVAAAVGFGVVPHMMPRRHARYDRTVWRMAAGVVAAVVGDFLLVVGLLAVLETLGGVR